MNLTLRVAAASSSLVITYFIWVLMSSSALWRAFDIGTIAPEHRQSAFILLMLIDLLLAMMVIALSTLIAFKSGSRGSQN